MKAAENGEEREILCLCRGLRLLCCFFCCVCCFAAVPVRAHQVLSPASTQRAINEVAAPIEQVRRVLLEEAGLRLPNEGLAVYLRRIALPLSGEASAVYKERIARYFVLLDQSARAAQSVHSLPSLSALRDTSPANSAQWEHINHVLPLLPGRVHKTRIAWQHVLQRAQPNPTTVKSAHFDTNLEETLQLVLAASNSLRDARP